MCNLPFDHIEIHETGDVFFCCPNWNYWNSIGNIFQSSLEEIWHSQKAKIIRDSIINNQYVFCNKITCPNIKHNLSTKNEGSIINKFPRFVTLCYDITCNLYCRSCRLKPMNIKNKEEQYQRAQLFQEHLIRSSFFSNVEEVTISGAGDALASDLYWSLIQSFRNLSSKPKLILKTNGLLFTREKWLELLPCIDLPLKEITISVDAATPGTYTKLRRGGDFDKLLKNFSFIKMLRDEGQIEIFNVVFVVQKENYLEIPLFVEMMKSYNVSRIIFTRIINWGTFEEKEFLAVDVAKRSHPEYAALEKIFNSSIMDSVIIDRFNLFNE